MGLLIKLGKNGTEIHELLCVVYHYQKSAMMRRVQVSETFPVGCDEVEEMREKGAL